MKVTTKSGSQYNVSIEVNPKGNLSLFAEKDGYRHNVVAIFPDRLDFFKATDQFRVEGGKLAGYNNKGVRTLFLDLNSLKRGMILVSKTGFQSTEIVDIRG